MKKIIFAFICATSIGINAQSQGAISCIQPLKSNGYISWAKTPTSNYKVNVYLIRPNNSPQLVSSTNCVSNYFRFDSQQLTTPDLYYTIAEYSSRGALISEGHPEKIGDTPPPSPYCSIDCNGLRESYRLSLMQRSNGTTFLMASDNAGIDTPTGQHTPYYQAISTVNYEQFDPSHPYRLATATTSGVVYARDHIQINANTPGGPFYDAQNSMVTSGWLVEKKMDKYAHMNGVNTGNYQSSTDWCEANIGTGTSIFNAHIDQSSVPIILYPMTSEQLWFAPAPIDSTIYEEDGGQHDTLFYRLPKLTCSTNYGGVISGTMDYDDLVEEMIDCFLGADSVLIDCITDVGNGFGGTIDGFTFESINADLKFNATFGSNNGRIVLRESSGRFTPGLYRVNIFSKNGHIVPKYQVFGVAPVIAREVRIGITPNPIVNSTLVFNVETNQDVRASIVVRKLDGTILLRESVNLVTQRALSRSVSIRGTVPYNQVIVAVELEDGTVIQETALTE